MAEIINLDQKRKEKWIEKIERMRELGEVAIFGVVGEVEAKIIPFERKDDGRNAGSNR